MSKLSTLRDTRAKFVRAISNDSRLLAETIALDNAQIGHRSVHKCAGYRLDSVELAAKILNNTGYAIEYGPAGHPSKPVWSIAICSREEYIQRAEKAVRKQTSTKRSKHAESLRIRESFTVHDWQAVKTKIKI